MAISSYQASHTTLSIAGELYPELFFGYPGLNSLTVIETATLGELLGRLSSADRSQVISFLSDGEAS